jgi:hypothetical protein
MIEAGEPWLGHAYFQTELTLPSVSWLNSMLPGLLLRTLARNSHVFSKHKKTGNWARVQEDLRQLPPGYGHTFLQPAEVCARVRIP